MSSNPRLLSQTLSLIDKAIINADKLGDHETARYLMMGMVNLGRVPQPSLSA